MQMGHIYFKQFLFMQGNLNNINNAVLMHFDVVGNGRVILSLRLIVRWLRKVLTVKILNL